MSGRVRYDHFAGVADEYWRTFGPEFSDLILPWVDRLIREHRIRLRSVLDLGCGTGSFAIRMALRGLQVTGLDASHAALQLARQKAGKRRVAVDWIVGDMRSFVLARRFDLVTSVFNSVNHLLSGRDLDAMFTAVSRTLVPGGHFIFDLNHRSCFEEVWGGVSVVRKSRFLLMRCDEIDRRRQRATAYLAICLKRKGRYVCTLDAIEERWFPEARVREAARRASLQVIYKENFNPFPEQAGYSPDIKSLWLLRRGT
ncbi:MAG: class I SAM-dependent methyltransferase [Acidobacteriia bacterium]|nr:class I SAM-dependent methyltransferase [Terriglobia bacterium]